MNASIYDKTDKGRAEIATRQHHLPARLRTLLLLVDGHKSADTLLQHTAPLGIDAGSLEALIADGFIVRTGPDQPDSPPEPTRRAVVLRRTANGLRRMTP